MPAPSAWRCHAAAASSSGTRSTSRRDVTRDGMSDEAAVVVGELVRGHGEVRVAEDREVLEANGRRRELRRRPRGLAEVDDRRPGSGGLDGRGRRRAPERIEDVARALAAERVLERRDEVLCLVEAERRVGAERRGPLEPFRAPARGDDPRGPEQLRRLDGDEPDRAGGAEHEDVLAAAERRAPRERQPPGETCDAERGGERRVGAVGHLDRVRVADRRSLGHRPVRRPSRDAAEDPDEPPVAVAADGFAPGDIRQLG